MGKIFQFRPWIDVVSDGYNYEFTGHLGQLVDQVLGKLNISSVIVHADTNETGTRLPNGTWTGLIGLLQDESADLVVSPVPYDLLRLEVSQFIRSFAVMEFNILSSDKSASEHEIFKLFFLFKKLIWLYALINIFVLFVFNSFQRLMARRLPERRDRIPNAGLDILYLYGAFVGRSMPWNTKVFSERWTSSSFLLISLVLSSAFIGKLLSRLAIPLDKLYIETREDLLRAVNVTPATWKGAYIEEFIKKSSTDLDKKVWKRFMENESMSLLPYDDFFSPRTVSAVASGDYVLFAYREMLYKLVSDNCHDIEGRTFSIGPPLVPPSYTGWATSKRVPESLIKQLRKKIQNEIEIGFFTRATKMLKARGHRCFTHVQDSSSYTALSLEMLFPIYFALAAGSLISLIALLSELCIFRLSTKRVDKALPKITAKSRFLNDSSRDLRRQWRTPTFYPVVFYSNYDRRSQR